MLLFLLRHSTLDHMKFSLLTALLLVLFFSCQPSNSPDTPAAASAPTKDESFRKALETHLEAVTTKDFPALKETVPASGELMWILPSGGYFTTAADFLENHEVWLQDTAWTMTTKVIQADWGQDYGTATVEADLREPERNGKPYFHRMFITYALKKMDDKWMVVMDHASTIEKSE